MPSSPIGVKLKDYPSRWKWKQKIMIPDDKTAHYYGIWYEERGGAEKNDWYAWLMCCEYGNFPYMSDAWYQVEELSLKHRCVIAMIRDFIGVDFNDN